MTNFRPIASRYLRDARQLTRWCSPPMVGSLKLERRQAPPLACAVVGGDRSRGKKAGEQTIAVTGARFQEQAPKSEGSPKDNLGEDHLDTPESMKNLPVFYKEKGDCDKAEPMLIQAIEGQRQGILVLIDRFPLLF